MTEPIKRFYFSTPQDGNAFRWTTPCGNGRKEGESPGFADASTAYILASAHDATLALKGKERDRDVRHLEQELACRDEYVAELATERDQLRARVAELEADLGAREALDD